jgi:putative SOS response-associated peptidase YedK
VRLDEETGEREMVLMEWGLVPYWSKMHKMISNWAHDDKLTSSGAWIERFQQRRCLIPSEFFLRMGSSHPSREKAKDHKTVGNRASKTTGSFPSAASGIGGRTEPSAACWKALPSSQWTPMTS